MSSRMRSLCVIVMASLTFSDYRVNETSMGVVIPPSR